MSKFLMRCGEIFLIVFVFFVSDGARARISVSTSIIYGTPALSLFCDRVDVLFRRTKERSDIDRGALDQWYSEWRNIKMNGGGCADSGQSFEVDINKTRSCLIEKLRSKFIIFEKIVTSDDLKDAFGTDNIDEIIHSMNN